jgi:hypothetical protein
MVNNHVNNQQLSVQRSVFVPHCICIPLEYGIHGLVNCIVYEKGGKEKRGELVRKIVDINTIK